MTRVLRARVQAIILFIQMMMSHFWIMAAMVTFCIVELGGYIAFLIFLTMPVLNTYVAELV